MASTRAAQRVAGGGPARALRRSLSPFLYRPAGMRLLRAARLLLAPREAVRRSRAGREALRGATLAARVDEQRGYVMLPPGSLNGLGELLARCERRLAELRPHLERLQASSSGNRRLTIDLLSDDALRREPELVDFALQDAVLLPAVEYLRTAPFLARVTLGLSVHLPELALPGYHQRFHADNDDLRHVKLYLLARDVGAEDGPLCLLPAETSARVLRALRREGGAGGRYATWSDEEVFRHCDPSELVRLCGPPGTAALIDLSRCLHYGSRVSPGRERLVLAATFLRWHRVHHNASNRLDGERPALDALRRLALRAPYDFPHGHFCPDPLEKARADGVDRG